MKFVYFCFLLVLFDVSFCVESSLKTKMEDAAVAPDVIDVAPENILYVTFPSNQKADFGNELTPTQVKDIPSLDWDADDKALYTVLMTDPDTPESIKEVRHWLVVNIPGKKVSDGKIVFDYIGSGPPKGTGLHRYVLLVFKQPKLIETNTFVPNTTREGRTKTKTRDLIKEYDLGTPVAGNFYRAQFDDYVPILHAQLGGPPPIVK